MSDSTNTAVDLTSQELDERRNFCFELEEQIKEGLGKSRNALWETAKALYEFDEEHGYSILGHESLGEWLADPEINMTRSTYYRLVKTYRALVVHRQIPAQTLQHLDVSKVDIVLPAIEAGRVTADDGLADAENLGARDLREKYIGRKRAKEPRPTVEEEHTAGVEIEEEAEAPTMAGWTKIPREQFEELPEGEEPGNLPTEPVPVVRPPAALPDGYSDLDEDEPEEVSGELEEAVSLDQALRNWEVLLEQLVSGLESGTPFPRISAQVIGPGVEGAELIIKDWSETTYDGNSR